MRYVGALSGAVGLAICGPLTATLLVGRTGILPSLRWAGMAAAAWLVAGGTAWAFGGRTPVLHRLAPLAALGAMAPLLIAAYARDSDYHVLKTGAAEIVLTELALLLAGALGSLPGVGTWLSAGPRSPAPVRQSRELTSPVLAASVGGVAAMLLLNDALLGPLGAQRPPLSVAIALIAFLAVILIALDVARRADRPRAGGTAGALALVGLAAVLAAWFWVAPQAVAVRVPEAVAAGTLVFALNGGLWAHLSRRGTWLCSVLAVAGAVLAFTDKQRFGLGARELVALAPVLLVRVPLVGAGLLVAALALAARATGLYASRSAATGGMRDA